MRFQTIMGEWWVGPHLIKFLSCVFLALEDSWRILRRTFSPTRKPEIIISGGCLCEENMCRHCKGKKKTHIRAFSEMVEHSYNDLCTEEERYRFPDAPNTIRTSIISEL